MAKVRLLTHGLTANPSEGVYPFLGRSELANSGRETGISRSNSSPTLLLRELLIKTPKRGDGGASPGLASIRAPAKKHPHLRANACHLPLSMFTILHQ
jgi:hypothetical protein